MSRRRLRTSRPALVLIRARKPCVLARRRLFGWKVRFIGYLPRFVNRVANGKGYRSPGNPSSHGMHGNTRTPKRLARRFPSGAGRAPATSPQERRVCTRSRRPDLADAITTPPTQRPRSALSRPDPLREHRARTCPAADLRVHTNFRDFSTFPRLYPQILWKTC